MWISLSVKMINKSSRTKFLNRIGLTFNAPNVAKKKKVSKILMIMLFMMKL